MWNRLKNSLTAASLATAIMLGLLTVAEPADSRQAPSASEQQAAYRLGVQIAALAIDLAVRESRADAGNGTAVADNADAVAAPAANPAPRSHPSRTPFYSFGSRMARVRGS